MGMKRVLLWGPQRRGFVKIDDEATKGATVGENLFNADGTLFDPSVLITEIVESTVDSIPSFFATIWRLIQEIPQTVKDIENGPWPTIRNNTQIGEEFTIPVGRQMLVYDEFDSAGTLIIEGDLVIL